MITQIAEDPPQTTGLIAQEREVNDSEREGRQLAQAARENQMTGKDMREEVTALKRQRMIESQSEL